MTTQTGGARTVDLGGPTSCVLPHGHEGNHEDGAIGWVGDECPIEISGGRYTTPRGARALIASLQRQLDALDPDAAIAEAERAWLVALEKAATLDAMMMDRVSEENSASPVARALLAAVKRAEAHAEQAEAAWLALVEARDVKGGVA